MKTITLIQAPSKAPPRRVSFLCTGEAMTKQSFNDECDINQIMAKFQKTGMIDHVNNRQPEYGDTSPQDYHESLNIIRKAEELFGELPSSVRKKFHNNPEDFLSFVQNPDNEAEIIKLGLTDNPIPDEQSEAIKGEALPNPGVPAGQTPSAGDEASDASASVKDGS